MKGAWSKILSTLRTEGFGNLANRTVRFLIYKARRLTNNKESNIRDWKGLKGSYEGKRVFLIGNGPSLNQTETYLLRDEFTMCFNRFDLMMERLAWRPTFYAVSDDRVLADTIDTVNQMTRRVQYAFYPDIHPYNVDFRDRIEKASNVLWLYLDRTGFSDNLPFCGINATVANVGLQILAHLGFKEIYLLGVDMTFSWPKDVVLQNKRDAQGSNDNDESHFDPRYFGKGRKFHWYGPGHVQEAFAKFREARAFLEPRGVRIFNATVGGALEEFTRVQLDDVLKFSSFEKRRRFIENIDRTMGNAVDVEAAFAEDPLSSSDPLPADVIHFKIRSQEANVFIKRHISDFIPFGPFEGVYLFFRRPRHSV